MLQLGPDIKVVQSGRDLQYLVNHVRQTRECALDTETTGLDRRYDYPICGSACPSIDSRYFITGEFLYPFMLDLYRERDIRWYFTNQNFDFNMLANLECPLPLGDCYDTLAMDWLHDENRAHGLKECSLDYLDQEMKSFNENFPQRKKGDTTAERFFRVLESNPSAAYEYATFDAWLTFRVFHHLQRELENTYTSVGHHLWDYYQRVELPFTKVLYNCGRRGCMVDQETLADMITPMDKEILSLQKQLNKIAGKEFNPNSPAQVRELLFDKLKLKVIKKTKGGASGKQQPSTDEDCLKVWAKDGVPAAQIMLQLRELNKFKGTYAVGLLKWADRAGRIHPTLNQHVTVTGRLSSVDPNLQLPEVIKLCELLETPKALLQQHTSKEAVRLAKKRRDKDNTYRKWAISSQVPKGVN